MKKLITFLTVFCFVHTLNAQLVYSTYAWEAKPTPATLTPSDEKENYVIVKNKLITEFAYESSGNLVMYTTEHIIIHFNTQKGIDERNKVFLSTRNVIEQVSITARTIKKDGKVIPLENSNIKSIDNYENSGPFVIFAMEGLEVGDEIEYLYTFKSEPNITGTRTMQSSSLKKNVAYEIISPQNLVFEARSYNGFPAMVHDTLLKDKNRLKAEIAEIKSVTEEKYSARKACLMRVEFKLAYNTSGGRSRIQTFEKAAVQFYELFFTPSKSELKELNKFIAKANIDKKLSDDEKIYLLENYIKTNIMVDEEARTGEIGEVIKNKVTSNMGISRLMINAFKNFGYKPELVLTSDRFERKFDETFDTWNNFTEFLIYFPETGKYLSPDDLLSRYGFPPAELTNNKGLFIKEVEIGDMKSGVGRIKTIEANDYSKSSSNMEIWVNIDLSTLTPKVKNISSTTGYSSYYTQPIYSFMNEEQKTEFGKTSSQFAGNETKVVKYEVKNFDQKEAFIKPFLIESEVECPHLIETAGDKILFQVGELIGPQAQLYQEGQRMTDAEIQYGHSFDRKIEITIPDGYKLTNPDDIKIKTEFIDNGQPVAQFNSTYEINGNKLSIHVYEDYRILLYPLARFEDFKKVINASADFNKVTLIFEKL